MHSSIMRVPRIKRELFAFSRFKISSVISWLFYPFFISSNFLIDPNMIVDVFRVELFLLGLSRRLYAMLSIVIIIIIKRELHTAYRASTGSYKSSIYLPHAFRDSQSYISILQLFSRTRAPFNAQYFFSYEWTSNMGRFNRYNATQEFPLIHLKCWPISYEISFQGCERSRFNLSNRKLPLLINARIEIDSVSVRVFDNVYRNLFARFVPDDLMWCLSHFRDNVSIRVYVNNSVYLFSWNIRKPCLGIAAGRVQFGSVC